MKIITSNEEKLTKQELIDLVWNFEHKRLEERNVFFENKFSKEVRSIIKLKKRFLVIEWVYHEEYKTQKQHILDVRTLYFVEFKSIKEKNWKTKKLATIKGWFKKDTDILL